MRTGIERDKHAKLCSRVKQSFTIRILAHDARGPIGWDTVLAVSQPGPRRAVVVGAVDVRLIVAEQPTIDGEVSRAFAMWRRLDVLHTTAARQIFRRHVRPLLAVVARDKKWTIVRSRPDHALLEWRLSNRIQRAVKLFASDVACNRFTAGALATVRMRRKIGRDSFPRHTFITRAMNVLRSVIQDIRIVRRRGHRRHALHAIDEIARG